MDELKSGWFSEISTFWPGQALSFKVEEVLHSETSEYQSIQVLDSRAFGKVLTLDGVIQCTEKDEFAYQEMISHIPLFSHRNPKKVLVVGGGDGGVLREIAKHDEVEEIHLCEIDERVIEVSKKYLPHMSVGFSEERVHIHIMDGAKFMEQHKNEFDVIIVDSSDPVGPAEVLYQKPFYETMKTALRENGIICTQGESLWLHLKVIKSVLSFSREIFPSVSYSYTTIPTYPSGQIGFIMGSVEKEKNFKVPVRPISKEVQNSLKYYSPEIHEASFVLPAFAKRELEI